MPRGSSLIAAPSITGRGSDDGFVRLIGSLETVVFAQFDPVGAGVTNLTITQPAGFIKPNSLTSIPATVTAPDLGGHTSYEVGKDLQVSGSVNLTVVPPNPVTITVTSSAPAVVTLSTDPAVAGGSSVAFADVTGTAGQVYYIQGRSVGSATLRVQAAGYNDLLINVSVGNSGFVIISPGQISTGVGSSDVPIEIGVGLLDTNNVLRTRQPVRGGLTVPVSIASSNTASGQLTASPVTFNPGALSGATAFHAVAGGSSTITLQTPQGFTSPAVGRQIVATVQ